MDASFKKVVPIKLYKMKDLRPREKILFVSMAILVTEDTAMDPYTSEIFQIKLTTAVSLTTVENEERFQERFPIKQTTAPIGTLLKIYCFPEHKIINIIKWSVMSPHESNALRLSISKLEMANKKEGDNNIDSEATMLNEAYQEYQEMEDDLDCSMVLEVNLFIYLFIISGN